MVYQEDYKNNNIAKYQNSQERKKALTQPSKIAKIELFRNQCKRIFRIGEKILDIGGGAGIWTDIIREEVGKVEIYALDISSDVLAERNNNDHCVVGDMEKLSFSDNTFDCAMFFAALHHVPNTKAALVEAMRVIKPDGRIVLWEPVSLKLLLLGQKIRPTPDQVEFCFSLRYLLQSIREVGGRVEQIYFEGFLRRFFPKNINVNIIRKLSAAEEKLNNILLVRWMLNIFASSVIVVVRK